MEVDESLATTGIPTLEEIVASCSSQPTTNEDESDSDEENEIVLEADPPVSSRRANEALYTLRQYLEENDAELPILRHSDEDYLTAEMTKKMKQSKISNYFTR